MGADNGGVVDGTAFNPNLATTTGWLKASATEVFVTPAPGKPHITIEAVND